MAVIYIRIDPQDKKSLELEAKRLGMTLTTYCRMVLLRSLEKNMYGAPKGIVHQKGNIYHIWIGEGEVRREELIQPLGRPASIR